MSTSVRVRAFAKINAGLKVLGRRPDGYHEIRTIYQTISLADRIKVSLDSRKSGVELECDDPAIPAGHANLAYQAAEFWRRERKERRSIRLHLEKRIPAGSGLGGGSSDAAATLLALEHLTGRRMAHGTLVEIAARLGSDVPLFLYGGRVLGCGRGNEIYPLADLPRRPCLIVFPGFSVSTADAYREISLRLTGRKASPKIDEFGVRPRFPLLEWGPAENDFEQVVFAKWPRLARLKRRLIRAGAEIASLTGSGSALYAIFESAKQLLRATGLVPPEWQAFRSRTLSRAEYQRRMFEP